MFDRVRLIFCTICGILLFYTNFTIGQGRNTYWQQEIKYAMEVELDVESNTFSGIQTIRYTNHSPETLTKVFFHLYLNAFQPGSVMDIRARVIGDVDPRMQPIWNLTPEEVGYQHISKLTQKGKPLKYEVVGTILEVELATPLKPGKTTTFEMEYDAQVPVTIRRMGRDNKEGVRFSMAQWFPKLCEYDKRGWHADPYIGKEYYGVWGDFDVRITLDASYTVAATGVLQNAKEIGHGYAPEPKEKKDKLTWHFVAKQVHDFVWAADPNYQHDRHTCKSGLELHAFYLKGEKYSSTWEELLPIMEEVFDEVSRKNGTYPYPVYSFIQGGDGGMEYAMATLITGGRSLTSLVGVSVHESLHSWYQMALGFNESYFYWMDEGFVQFFAERVMDHLQELELIPGYPDEFPYEGFYANYARLVEAGLEEPMSTHADFFNSHTAYSTSAYTKGAIFLNQLEYIIGKEAFDQGILEFFEKWKFKHPDDNDFIRVMELASDMELDWYLDAWVNSIKTIDYGVDTVYGNEIETIVYLRRTGLIPMPVDFVIETADGESLWCTVPLDIMRGEKIENSPAGTPYLVMPDWDWVHPYYYFTLPYGIEEIQSIRIDPSRRLADLDDYDNIWPSPSEPKMHE